MTTKDYFSEVVGMTWWRADRYEIRDDYITPAADAEWHSFDPWEEFERSAPHLSLMRLINDLDPGRLRAEGPPWQFEPAIEDWASRNGLLGLLHQRTHEVTLHPQRGGLPSRPATTEFSSTRYIRGGGGWVEDLQGPRTLKNVTPGPPDGSYGRRAPEVVLDPPFGDRDTGRAPYPERLSTTWTSYFPGIAAGDREGFPYPSPGSLEFFKLYAEPVGEFLRVGRLLLNSLEALNAERPFDRTGSPDDESIGKLERSSASLRFLNGLTQSAELIAGPGPGGTVRQAWWTPSLLGAIAVMTLSAVTGSLPPRICAAVGCGELFTPVRRATRYHSARCKDRQKKRDYRARERARAQEGE